MLHHSTIRRVHEWAIATRGELTLAQAMSALNLAKSTVYGALAALEKAGFATRRKVKSTGTTPLDYWTVTGSADDILRKFCADLPPERPPLAAFEQVRDVFEYAERCAKGW